MFVDTGVQESVLRKEETPLVSHVRTIVGHII